MPTSHQLAFEITTDGDHRQVLHAIGDIDLQTAPDLKRHIERASEPGEPLVIDLRQVRFMDSPGLGMLIHCDRHQRERGGRLILQHPVGAVRDLFVVVGLADAIDIEP